jgi:hypothetical protein
MDDWHLPTSEELLTRRLRDRIAQPRRERSFLYGRYEAFLDRLAASPRVRVVPHVEFDATTTPGVLVSLRHDVDDRLDAALAFARLEHERGLRATYFVLHTAPYYGPAAVEDIRALQERYGHEVGWHNDLVTIECVEGVDARAYLAVELARLRDAGIDVRGVASHGAYWGHVLGYDNTYFFSDFPEIRDGFPNRDAVVLDGVERRVPKGTLAEFGFEYDANHLNFDRFYSDARFSADGRRWTPDELDLDELPDGSRVVVLVHADHWDASLPRKVARLYRRGAVRSAQLLLRRARRRSTTP